MYNIIAIARITQKRRKGQIPTWFCAKWRLFKKSAVWFYTSEGGCDGLGLELVGAVDKNGHHHNFFTRFAHRLSEQPPTQSDCD